MFGDFPYGGRPSSWIAKDGLPARIVGRSHLHDKRPHHDGIPSAETDSGFQVYENVYVMMGSGIGWTSEVRIFPWSYDTTCTLTEGGLVPLHHGVEALWQYRPLIYRMHLWDDVFPVYLSWERQGSQRELQWRHALHEVIRSATRFPDDPSMHFADKELSFLIEKMAMRRAEQLLESMLAAPQLYEWRLGGRIRCIGGATGKTYSIEEGNGFAEVDQFTNNKIVSYCLHPEDWMPDADVALATKLHLEDPEAELEFVAGANGTVRGKSKDRRRTVDERYSYANDMERELIAA